MPPIEFIMIIFLVLFLIVLGLVLLMRRGPGRMPGDITVRTRNVGCYFPVITSLLVSVALTIILNLILWMFRC